LHLENIVQHGDDWVIIDPKGIIGEVAFEAAAFDLLSDEELKLENSKIQDILNRRIKKLALALDIDSARLLAWVYLRVVISVQWFIEDNGDPSKMMRLMQLIYPLLALNG